MIMLIEPSDPVLTKVAEDVPPSEIQSKEIQTIIDEMLSVASGARDGDVNKRKMVGLAAPQMGISKKIILVDVEVDAQRKNLGKIKAYINPKIVWRSDDLEEGREGCFSIDDHVMGIVPRSTAVKISAFDRNGTPVFEEHFGFTARIFQHEIDHLQGIRFPDRIGEKGILHWVEKDEYLAYRESWKTWPKRCPYTTWLAMREGREFQKPH